MGGRISTCASLTRSGPSRESETFWGGKLRAWLTWVGQCQRARVPGDDSDPHRTVHPLVHRVIDKPGRVASPGMFRSPYTPAVLRSGARPAGITDHARPAHSAGLTPTTGGAPDLWCAKTRHRSDELRFR